MVILSLLRSPYFSSVLVALSLYACIVNLFLPWKLDTYFSEKVAVKKVHNDVYHSEEVFEIEYGEMERKFKIYVYPHEEEPANYDTTVGKYASEGYFFKNIRESPFLTDDPHRAHLFFIPISLQKLHQKAEAEYDGWGLGSVVAMLCIVILLVFLPLGMGPSPVQPPSFSILFVFPVFMAVILILLSQASRAR